MNFPGQGFQKLECYSQTHTQTAVTESITTPHSHMAISNVTAGENVYHAFISSKSKDKDIRMIRTWLLVAKAYCGTAVCGC